MVKTTAVQIRLTKDEHSKIKLNAQMKGFKTASEYIRFVTLQQDDNLYRMIQELHQKMINPLANGASTSTLKNANT